MPEVCRVARFANITYTEALALPADAFALIRKHSFIDELNRSEEGRKYLADCERLKQTKPDLEKLRSMSGYKREEEPCPTSTSEASATT